MAHIVLVDDDPAILEVVGEVLREHGHTVAPFTSTQEAVTAIKSGGQPPDLVVTDLDLGPGGDGLDVVREVDSWSAGTVPVIVLSGLGSEEDFVTSFTAGARDFICKPASPGELAVKCAMHLEGSPLPPPLTEDAGPAARFKLGRQIGQGGNGAVYAARDRETGDTVALKFLSRGADVDPTACARFLRETCTLAQVHDPHVVDVLEVGVYEGSPFLAMEWIAGESLQDRVYDDRTATPEEALGLARGLAHALAAISRAGLVHRDLKPANVMLRDGRFDQPVLIDFGLAKRPDDRSLTISGCLLGTPGYIAPEVANGASPSPQSDVFGLGAVVRFALCGQHVFPGLGGYRLIEAIAMQPIDVPRCGHPGLRALLEDLLSRDLARRPKSAGEVLERLERLAPVGGSASSQTSELGYRAKPTVVVRRPRATEAVDGGSAPSPADNHS